MHGSSRSSNTVETKLTLGTSTVILWNNAGRDENTSIRTVFVYVLSSFLQGCLAGISWLNLILNDDRIQHRH